ncbi:MAG: hypothetical protein IJW05_13030, partial [Lentisphaeria bacterium]|nr:hypothetical protein [Lentisphaeria bacterium]
MFHSQTLLVFCNFYAILRRLIKIDYKPSITEQKHRDFFMKIYAPAETKIYDFIPSVQQASKQAS